MKYKIEVSETVYRCATIEVEAESESLAQAKVHVMYEDGDLTYDEIVPCDFNINEVTEAS